MRVASKILLPAAIAAALSGAPALAEPGQAASPPLLPAPRSMTVAAGLFHLGPHVPVVASDAGERNAAARLAELLARATGLHLAVTAKHSPHAIHFVRKPGFEPEGYEIKSTPDGITISASTDSGLLYGAVTVWQLATGADPGAIPAVTIRDAPRFAWRGLMLDSARHFQSVGYIRHLIDWMAVNKLNRLHWHLVDDQGWRLEIKKYPRLTEVSAWRRPATAPGAPPLPVTGGFYTQAQVRELVAYAAARGITIVPEIEMPGHALSAIRAYPKLGMGVPIPPGTESDWGVFPWLYNVDDATFGFLEDVLTEVMALFPSRYIHVGGDEAVKDQWKASPAIQAKMRALGISNEDALQGWFVGRIGAFLARHNRQLIGWDEILDGGVPADATITSWRGVDGAIKAAKSGHDAVLSPAPTLYFDNRQGFGAIEPPGRGNLVSLADVYTFDPLPKQLSPDEQRHILGVQGNLWTEHVRTEPRAAWMTFPRASAVAEIGWSHPEKPDLGSFLPRLILQMERMRALGLEPAASVFVVHGTADFVPPANKANIALASQSGLAIRYTLDGSAPSAASPLYTAPLSLTFPARLRAATFFDGKPLPGALDMAVDAQSVRRRIDEQLETCTAKVRLDLEDDYPADGPRATFLTDILDPCWVWKKAPVEGATRIALEVGQLPFNFQIGKDIEALHFRPPVTPDGEFEVRAGGCDGERVAVLPLVPARANPGVTRLVGALTPRKGLADLCISYTARGPNPMWALKSIELIAP